MTFFQGDLEDGFRELELEKPAVDHLAAFGGYPDKVVTTRSMERLGDEKCLHDKAGVDKQTLWHG